jgi:hypothetical protein
LVYYINLFYKFFIPLVLGGMVALVGLDVGHAVYVRTGRGKSRVKPQPKEDQSPPLPESSIQPPPSENNRLPGSEHPGEPQDEEEVHE